MKFSNKERQEILQMYLEWTTAIFEDLDWKDKVSPEDLVNFVLNIVERVK